MAATQRRSVSSGSDNAQSPDGLGSRISRIFQPDLGGLPSPMLAPPVPPSLSTKKSLGAKLSTFFRKKEPTPLPSSSQPARLQPIPERRPVDRASPPLPHSSPLNSPWIRTVAGAPLRPAISPSSPNAHRWAGDRTPTSPQTLSAFGDGPSQVDWVDPWQPQVSPMSPPPFPTPIHALPDPSSRRAQFTHVTPFDRRSVSPEWGRLSPISVNLEDETPEFDPLWDGGVPAMEQLERLASEIPAREESIVLESEDILATSMRLPLPEYDEILVRHGPQDAENLELFSALPYDIPSENPPTPSLTTPIDLSSSSSQRSLEITQVNEHPLAGPSTSSTQPQSRPVGLNHPQLVVSPALSNVANSWSLWAEADRGPSLPLASSQPVRSLWSQGPSSTSEPEYPSWLPRRPRPPPPKTSGTDLSTNSFTVAPRIPALLAPRRIVPDSYERGRIISSFPLPAQRLGQLTRPSPLRDATAPVRSALRSRVDERPLAGPSTEGGLGRWLDDQRTAGLSSQDSQRSPTRKMTFAEARSTTQATENERTRPPSSPMRATERLVSRPRQRGNTVTSPAAPGASSGASFDDAESSRSGPLVDPPSDWPRPFALRKPTLNVRRPEELPGSHRDWSELGAIPRKKVPGRLAASLPGRSTLAAKAISHDPALVKECTICREDFPISPASPLRKSFSSSTLATPDFPTTPPTPRCLHEPATCRQCIGQHIESRLEERGINAVDDMDCPSPNCREKLGYDEVKQWASSDSFALFETLQFKQFLTAEPNFVWCKKAGCKGGQLHDEGDRAPIVTCNDCSAKACFTHDMPWHAGMTCDEYEASKRAEVDDIASRATLARDTKNCPSCNSRIFKDGGCEHMKCLAPGCGHDFCWLCLASHSLILKHGNHYHINTCRFYAPPGR